MFAKDTISTPDRIRTYDPRIRSPMLYPAELQALYTAHNPYTNTLESHREMCFKCA